MNSQLFPDYPVLVVDDEQDFLNSIDFKLRSHGVTNVECCKDSRKVMPLLENKRYSIVLLDLLMPNISGDQLLPEIVDKYPQIPVIIVTAFPEIEKTAVDYMRTGAYDYVVKPPDTDDLVRTIKELWELRDVYKDIIPMKRSLFSQVFQKSKEFPDIISQSDKVKSVYETIGLIATTAKPVLIRGEKGVGKEFVAREIHKQSRRKGEFIALDPSGLDDELFSEVFFGCIDDKASTGEKEKVGLLEEAKDGTLFLNDITDLSIPSQVKILRFLREHRYSPVGSKSLLEANVRIIAASRKNLSALVKVGMLREDLYGLIKTHEIIIPPLRERKEDIFLLFAHFFKNALDEFGIKEPNVPKELFQILENYDFPGNVGELKRMVLEAVARYKSDFLPLGAFLEAMKNSPWFDDDTSETMPPDEDTAPHNKVIFRRSIPTYADMEVMYLNEVLKRSKGDYNVAARLAGLNKKSFIFNLKKAKKKLGKGNK
jgi:DNA-binding NtrC family response regulator